MGLKTLSTQNRTQAWRGAARWPPLAAILRTACAPDPARRYANAQAMHEALKALGGGPGAAPRTHA